MEVTISGGDVDMVIQQLLTIPRADVQKATSNQKKRKTTTNVGSQ